MAKFEKKLEREHMANVKRWEAAIAKEKYNKKVEIHKVHVGQQMGKIFRKLKKRCAIVFHSTQAI